MMRPTILVIVALRMRFFCSIWEIEVSCDKKVASAKLSQEYRRRSCKSPLIASISCQSQPPRGHTNQRVLRRIAQGSKVVGGIVVAELAFKTVLSWMRCLLSTTNQRNQFLLGLRALTNTIVCSQGNRHSGETENLTSYLMSRFD